MVRLSIFCVLVVACSLDTTGLRSTNPDGSVGFDTNPGGCLVGSERSCGSDVGACERGIQTCQDDGEWGPCEGEVSAAEELCDTESVDEDCDGMANELCACTPGQMQPCGDTAVGACAMGMQTCGEDAVWAETCEGLILPIDELCDDIDNDCDGNIDEDAKTRFYADSDGDGYGDPATVVEACTRPADHVAQAGDCDDDDSSRNPDAAEMCNAVDDNCDGNVDEGVSPPTWYLDDDEDGYGDATRTMQACDMPPRYVDNGDDCDDTSNGVSPAGTESCNLMDDDCDGAVDEDSVVNNCRSVVRDGRNYLFCDDGLSWAVARDRCNTECGGAYQLVVIGDMAENDFVRSEVTGHAWVAWYLEPGANGYSQVDRRWSWVGEESSYSPDWDSNEPNDNGGYEDEDENCGELRENGRYNDADCDNSTRFVCEEAP